jgi:hypothetical protein
LKSYGTILLELETISIRDAVDEGDGFHAAIIFLNECWSLDLVKRSVEVAGYKTF